MKHFTAIVLFLVSLFYIVNADQSVHTIFKLKTHNSLDTLTPSQNRPLLHTPLSYEQNIYDYINSLTDMVEKTRVQLKTYRNNRQPTKYSVHDIIFSVTQYLPNWAYPASVWKEDPITRRRHIAKVLHSTPISDRSRLTALRDNAVEWTKSSRNELANVYIPNTIERVESLLRSAEKFINAATDIEFMDEAYLANSFVALDDSLTRFITKNKQEFDSIIHSISHEFEELFSMAGDLRLSVESVRYDAIQTTKTIHDNIFARNIQKPLHQLHSRILTELKTLSQDFQQISDDGKEASKLLKNHAVKSLQADIDDLHDIKLILLRLKDVTDQIWNNASDELIQSPTSIAYWIDTTAEIKEAILNLGRFYVKKYQNRHCHCHCKYRI